MLVIIKCAVKYHSRSNSENEKVEINSRQGINYLQIDADKYKAKSYKRKKNETTTKIESFDPIS